MTNDNTTRKKANAVFFAAVMVLSMVAAGFAAAPAAAFNDEYDNPDREFTDESDIAGEILWQGQSVVVDGFNDSESVSLREDQGDDDTRLVEELTADSNGVVAFDTADLDSGDYYLDNGDGNNDQIFEVAVQGLSADFDGDSVQADEVAELELDSNRGTYTLNVSADGDLDDDELVQLFDEEFDIDLGEEDDDEITLESVSDGTFDANVSNVSDIDTGEYEFTFDVVDTEAEDTASINVTEAGEGDLQFSQSSYSTAQGDVVNVTVEFDETDSGTLVVGDLEDDNYQANISLVDDDDDGEVSVLFNTWEAGRSGDVVEPADDDDAVELENQSGDLTDLLDTGDYTMSVSPTTLPDNGDATDALEDESDVSSLVLEERSTDEMVLWRTTDDVRDDVVDVAGDDGDDAAVTAITDGVENGVVTETDQVALGNPSDVLVHQISATGLEGALENQSGVNARSLHALLNTEASGDDTPDDTNVTSLVFEEQNPGANAEANEIDASTLSEDNFAAAVDIVYDDANGDYYLFLDLDELNGALTEEIEDGDTYTADFTVQDPLLTAADGQDDNEEEIEDAYESASATFDAVEADGDFNGDPVQVSNAENQSITGTMNVAPGTEFTVRARSDEDASTNFIKNAEGVVVQPDGTFSAQFDFSEQELNDTFTTTTQQSPLTEELEVDGEVVEAVGSPAMFEVSDLSPAEATATAGDSVTVSATVENTGGQSDTQSVALTLDGDELDSQDVTLDAGASQTVEFTADTSGLGAGDYTHGIVTDDDEATGTLTIETDGGEGDSTGDSEGDSTGDSEGDSTGDETEDGTPGFGALVALVALIAAALLATRRND